MAWFGFLALRHAVAFEEFTEFYAVGVGDVPHCVAVVGGICVAVGVRAVAFRSEVDEGQVGDVGVGCEVVVFI